MFVGLPGHMETVPLHSESVPLVYLWSVRPSTLLDYVDLSVNNVVCSGER